MAVLALLNGVPASGKSTIASAIADVRPMLLRLDVDVVRHHIGGWLDQPHEAGLAARRLALAMAETHLRAGHDVMVPQFVARPEFVDQLTHVADDTAARFVHVALDVDGDRAVRAFHERARTPTSSVDADAAALLERSVESLSELHQRLVEFLTRRPEVVIVPVGHDDLAANVASVSAAIWPT